MLRDESRRSRTHAAPGVLLGFLRRRGAMTSRRPRAASRPSAARYRLTTSVRLVAYRVPSSLAVDTPLNQFPHEIIDPAIALDEGEKWDKLWSQLFLGGKPVEREE